MLTINRKAIQLVSALVCSIVLLTQSAHASFQNLTAPSAGNPDGKVTLVEFFDYRCSHCARMAPVMESLIKTNPNLRIVFIDYPVLGQVSELAARAAIAADKQGKYFEFNQALLQSHQGITEGAILQTAKVVGLNVEKMERDMASDAVTQQLEANVSLAQQFHVDGTPAFIVGRTNAADSKNYSVFYGEATKGELETAIQKAVR